MSKLIMEISNFVSKHNDDVEKVFGSWYNALLEVGIELKTRRYSKEDAIFKLKKIYQERGNFTATEYIQNKYTPSYATIKNLFGSWENALTAANVPQCVEPLKKYTDEEIIDALKQFYREYKENTSEYKYKKLKRKPGLTTIYNRFGNWNNALTVAGLPTRKSKSRGNMTDEEIVQIIRKSKEEIKGNFNSVTYNEWAKENDQVSFRYLNKKYGRWENILEFARINKSN
jgi:hypothetical protein